MLIHACAPEMRKTSPNQPPPTRPQSSKVSIEKGKGKNTR